MPELPGPVTVTSRCRASIASTLADSDARPQASLAATLEWSYRLLGEPERRAFRRLSVFPAPFTLDAARAAAGPDAALLVARLVRRSLLVAPRAGPDGRSRYRLLETVRAYALARLEESAEREETAAAVASWTVSEAERAGAGFETPDDQVAGQWGDAEQDNLREVLEWLLQQTAAVLWGASRALGLVPRRAG